MILLLGVIEKKEVRYVNTCASVNTNFPCIFKAARLFFYSFVECMHVKLVSSILHKEHSY